MKRSLASGVALAFALGAAAASRAHAQTPESGPRQVVLSRPSWAAVAVSLHLPVGSHEDPDGMEGLAWLLGRVLEAEAAQAFAHAAAVISIDVDRASTIVSILSLPESWESVSRTVDSIVHMAPIDDSVVSIQRTDLISRLEFEAGSPVRDFENETIGLLVEPGNAWARPVQGTPMSLGRLDAEALDAFRRTHYRRGASLRVVVGPVEESGATLGEDFLASASPDAAGRPMGIAWLEANRVLLVRDVTSTWVSVGYPVPPGVPRTDLEMMVYALREDLDPTPPDPDRYDVDVRIEETPRGAVLLLEAAVFPESADWWEARILSSVQRMRAVAVDEELFRSRRRGFRSVRLLEDAAPEASASRIAADLLRDGAPRALDAEIDALDAGSLLEAARALGEPRILRLGPDLAGPPGPGDP